MSEDEYTHRWYWEDKIPLGNGIWDQILPMVKNMPENNLMSLLNNEKVTENNKNRV